MEQFFLTLAEGFDLPILEWIAAHIRCAFLDVLMPAVTVLGNSGIFWIILAVLFLCIPKYRKMGLGMGAALLLVLCRGGVLPFLPSLALFAVFAVYLWNNVVDAKAGMAASRSEHPARRTTSHRQMVMKLGMFAIGIAAIVVGSRLLIDYGSELALLLGVPSSIIGVTMVAIGTSLPELVTTLTAIAKKEASMSVGNIIGANVIDLTMILPVCSAVSGGTLTIGSQTTALDLPVCLALCCVAAVPPLLKGKFYRWQGVLMLAVYAAYVVILVM